jgi:hypothetical protein
MGRIGRIMLLFAVMAVTLSLAGTSFAGDYPKAEIGVGYSYLYDSELGDVEGLSGSAPFGLVGDFNVNLTSWFGIVGTFNWNTRTQDLGGIDLKWTVTGFHGGFRLSSHSSESVTPYIQMLAGGTHSSADLIVAASDTNFSIQPGAGVIIAMGDSLGLNFGADYRRIFFEGEGSNEFLAHVGITFKLGN